MAAILDAAKAYNEWERKLVLFGEAEKKYQRYVEVRDRLKHQPLTDAERKVVETAKLKADSIISLPFAVAFFGPPGVWLWNRRVRKVQNRFLLMIARQPFNVIAMYTIPVVLLERYARAHVADKFFTRDSGVAQLAEKYPPVVSNEGAKSDEAADGFIYRLDRTSEGATSGGTGY